MAHGKGIRMRPELRHLEAPITTCYHTYHNGSLKMPQLRAHANALTMSHVYILLSLCPHATATFGQNVAKMLKVATMMAVVHQ